MLDTLGYKLHLQYVVLIDFLLQQWLDENMSMVRYIYVTCLACICLFHAHFLVQFVTQFTLSFCLPDLINSHYFPQCKTCVMCHKGQLSVVFFSGSSHATQQQADCIVRLTKLEVLLKLTDQIQRTGNIKLQSSKETFCLTVCRSFQELSTFRSKFMVVVAVNGSINQD